MHIRGVHLFCMPPINTDEHRCPDSLTERVIGAILEVSNVLGAGFLEKVYERALLHELGLRGIRATAQAPLTVRYKERCIGQYCADLLIEDVLVVELKCVDRLANEHVAQCLNYLRASGRNVCLLVNFQRPKVEWRRIILGFEHPEPAVTAEPTNQPDQYFHRRSSVSIGGESPSSPK